MNKQITGKSYLVFEKGTAWLYSEKPVWNQFTQSWSLLSQSSPNPKNIHKVSQIPWVAASVMTGYPETDDVNEIMDLLSNGKIFEIQMNIK